MSFTKKFSGGSVENSSGMRGGQRFLVCLFFAVIFGTGCAHYPVNPRIKQPDPARGYRGKFMVTPERSDQMLLYVTFSGGGTRAAAFSYGVLEALRDIEVTAGGRKRRLLDEIDAISSVSGGSFTAAYYGLFGDRIFEDFESKFLKKNIQGAIFRRTLFNPVNWARLFSPYFDRSDLAAEYYDKHVFEKSTFNDMAESKGPMILINATDMITGIRLPFTQDLFDVICSDISDFPVARATAASSAVPILLTPITLRNYANSCGFSMPEELDKILKEQDVTKRQFHHINNLRPYLDAENNRYIHLVDGGVADNLGVRAALDRVLALGDVWNTLKYAGHENVRKVIFIIVNAETEISGEWQLFGKPPPFGAMLQSYSSIAITRYNFETVMLLRESFARWTDEIQKNRCGSDRIDTEPGACGDIEFYLVEIKFDALKDEAERTYFKQLPTSFKLAPEEVDKLRAVAGRLLGESEEFQRLLGELKVEKTE
jgi:NTE family protein